MPVTGWLILMKITNCTLLFYHTTTAMINTRKFNVSEQDVTHIYSDRKNLALNMEYLL